MVVPLVTAAAYGDHVCVGALQFVSFGPSTILSQEIANQEKLYEKHNKNFKMIIQIHLLCLILTFISFLLVLITIIYWSKWEIMVEQKHYIQSLISMNAIIW